VIAFGDSGIAKGADLYGPLYKLVAALSFEFVKYLSNLKHHLSLQCGIIDLEIGWRAKADALLKGIAVATVSERERNDLVVILCASRDTKASTWFHTYWQR
jgi:hypothetical protein